MRQRFARWTALAVLLLFLAPAAQVLAGEAEDKVSQAATVLEEIMAIPESAIPPNLLGNAYGIAIVPGVIKAGFVIGARYGTGVVLVRDSAGCWSPA